ncbi:MAG: hypothetical protein JXQ75_24275, partial [Phycisphaerae bacterium]|nr:hypothetical protein [Phycisphaerae bacterium]
HVKDHIEEARRKEGGLDPAMLSYLLDRVRVDRVPDYVLAPLDLQDFQAFIAKLRQTLAGMAFPERE